MIAETLLARALLATAARGPTVEAAPGPARPAVVDLHCHTAGIGAGGSGCRVSDRMRRSWKYGVYLDAFGVTETELAAQGDGLIIRRLSELLASSAAVDFAVVLALDGFVGQDGRLDPDRTDLLVPDEFVASETRKYENLLWGASIHPGRPDALERLDRAAANGASLVKWLPNMQGMDPSDPRWRPFYRRLAELRMPLLVHTGPEAAFTWTDNSLGEVSKLELPLSCGVTVIAAHGVDSRRVRELAARYANLYVEISATTQINRLGHLQKLLRAPELRDRLLYGSDMPLLETALVSPWYSLFRLGPAGAWRIWRTANPWDRDVRLKTALGVPASAFARSRAVLRQPRTGPNAGPKVGPKAGPNS